MSHPAWDASRCYTEQGHTQKGPRRAVNRSTTWRSWSRKRGHTVGGRTRPRPGVGAACFQLLGRSELISGDFGEGAGPSLSTPYKSVRREDGIASATGNIYRREKCQSRPGRLHTFWTVPGEAPRFLVFSAENQESISCPRRGHHSVTVVTVSTEARDQRPRVQLEGGQREPLPWGRELNFRPHTNKPGLLGSWGLSWLKG